MSPPSVLCCTQTAGLAPLPRGPRAPRKENQQAEVTRAKLRPLLKPQTRCFQNHCPHGPAPSRTQSTDHGRQSPQFRPAPNSRQENRAAGWQFSTCDDRVRGGPGPPVPEVSFREAKRRTAPFTAGVYRDQPALGSGRRLPVNKCSSENLFQNRDAFPRTVKAIKMQNTSLEKTEPKSQLTFKIARHLVSVCAPRTHPRTHWQPRPLPGTPPAQRSVALDLLQVQLAVVQREGGLLPRAVPVTGGPSAPALAGCGLPRGPQARTGRTGAGARAQGAGAREAEAREVAGVTWGGHGRLRTGVILVIFIIKGAKAF